MTLAVVAFTIYLDGPIPAAQRGPTRTARDDAFDSVPRPLAHPVTRLRHQRGREPLATRPKQRRRVPELLRYQDGAALVPSRKSGHREGRHRSRKGHWIGCGRAPKRDVHGASKTRPTLSWPSSRDTTCSGTRFARASFRASTRRRWHCALARDKGRSAQRSIDSTRQFSVRRGSTRRRSTGRSRPRTQASVARSGSIRSLRSCLVC